MHGTVGVARRLPDPCCLLPKVVDSTRTPRRHSKLLEEIRVEAEVDAVFGRETEEGVVKCQCHLTGSPASLLAYRQSKGENRAVPAVVDKSLAAVEHARHSGNIFPER